MSSPRATYILLLVGAALWCATLVVAPLLVTFPGVPGAAGRLFYSFFHPICHQLSDRSFHLFGEPLAVCSRCASIYFAFLAGTLLYPAVFDLRRPVFPHRAFLLAAVLPMVIDICAGVFGVHEVTNTTRLFTGVVFGLVAPFYIVPAAIEALQFRGAGLGARPLLSDTHKEKGPPHA
jgi:uncharacterized membrane protein